MKLPLAGGKYRKPAHFVSTTLAYLALALWLFAMGARTYYDMFLPEFPDPASGRVIAKKAFGRYVYFTRAQLDWISLAEICAVSCFVAAFLAAMFVQSDFRKRRPKPWEVRRF